MKTKIDFYNLAFDLGYNTAKGNIGTKWMMYSSEDKEEIDFSDINNIDEWVEGWTQTNQWEYETRILFEKLNKNNDDWLDDYADIRTGWVDGYVAYIREIEEI